jgi:hypothetical protein
LSLSFFPAATDADLRKMAVLKQIRTLNLYYTKVTQAGLKELRQALPECEIHLPW